MKPRSKQLVVCIDHAAFLRQAGLSGRPDLSLLARAALDGGADGISMRIFGDRRGIQDADLAALAPNHEYRACIALPPDPQLVDLVARTGPAACCFVPERRHQHTTGGGLDCQAMLDQLRALAERLSAARVDTMAFVDPVAVQIDACAAAGLQGVCLNTGAYSLTSGSTALARRMEELADAALHAASLGMKVRARGGLDDDNVGAIATIGDITEIEMGHAIFAMAVVDGLARSVAKVKHTLSGSVAK